ncbi:hypothetical protein LCGC14_1900460 [marine sediment metagenome]|uniref:Uncharacterized protein n=1 Tax=marine sediment metagenome TaxID=412755 RepID=A0A0F9GK49_9ZZZZ
MKNIKELLSEHEFFKGLSDEQIEIIAGCGSNVHFKKGETLRLTVEGWFKTTEGVAKAAHLLIGHDPQNREYKQESIPENINAEIELANEENQTVSYQKTQMTFHVPFVLDL